jgi:phosphorylcholine metabolism protein LicD
MIPQKWIIDKIDAIMTKNNEKPCKRQGNLFFPKAINYFDGIYPALKVNFEKREVYIPKGYEVNLKNRYGDIREDPPEEARVGHRPHILNLNSED